MALEIHANSSYFCQNNQDRTACSVGFVEAHIYHMIALKKAEAMGLCHLRGRLGCRVHFLVLFLRNGGLGCLVALWKAPAKAVRPVRATKEMVGGKCLGTMCWNYKALGHSAQDPRDHECEYGQGHWQDCETQVQSYYFLICSITRSPIIFWNSLRILENDTKDADDDRFLTGWQVQRLEGRNQAGAGWPIQNLNPGMRLCRRILQQLMM